MGLNDTCYFMLDLKKLDLNPFGFELWVRAGG